MELRVHVLLGIIAQLSMITNGFDSELCRCKVKVVFGVFKFEGRKTTEAV